MKTDEAVIYDMTARLLTGAVNEQLHEQGLALFEIDPARRLGFSGVYPVICVRECERSEKERVIEVSAYTITISFRVKDCADRTTIFGYARAIELALEADLSLGGIADRVCLTHKKYTPPEETKVIGAWDVALTLRVTIERTRL